MADSGDQKYLLIINENGTNGKTFSVSQQEVFEKLRKQNYLPIIIEEAHVTDIVYSLMDKVHTTLSVIPIYRLVKILGLVNKTKRLACVGSNYFDTFNYSVNKDEIRKVILEKSKVVNTEDGTPVVRWDKMIQYLDNPDVHQDKTIKLLNMY